MDQDQVQDRPNSPTNGSEIRNSTSSTTEPAVRSRWTPKPEQILILESIFNSGMVNPPKDETVRIRKLLEKFGSVGDANVFYWFQNRRSRSRRRQRQLQAQLNNIGGAIQYESSNSTTATSTTPAAAMAGFGGGSAYSFLSSPSNSSYLMGGCSSSKSCGGLGDDHGHVENSFFQVSGGQMGFPEIEQNSAVTSVLYPPDSSNMHFQLSGFVTVFINGVPTEVPKGPIDLKPMFGQDVILVHSSGVPVPTNDFGILLQSLQRGESYFLVPRAS
ncbi:Homeodomain transcription factor [Parasponia andersonii]|uniref:Homeodomain transcription factor n=1 Tax=Parasponia andersonii TaxID=3476 RepID=A0A2P5CU04_PARAD|nr:Homeodomain transcription factor [Parasponia andersonii]